MIDIVLVLVFFDCCVDDIWVLWRNCQVDFVYIVCGKFCGDFVLGFIVVIGYVNIVFWFGVYIGSNGVVVLLGGSDQLVGIVWIYDDVGYVGLFVCGQDQVLGFVVIGGFVEIVFVVG